MRETHDTFTLEIEPARGALAFRPGQFNMVYAFGAGEVPLSLSGDPGKPGRVVHTTREVGAVTRALGRLRVGAALGVRGPFGRAWPLDAAVGRDVVVAAGGIGLAPLRPLLHEIAARRREFARVVLLYGTRSPEDLLFRRQLERWVESAGLTLSITVDHATRGWPGNVGVVTALVPLAPFDGARTTAFVCGPEVMMRLMADALGRRGVSDDHIHVSLERNMKCALGFCGHCQLGPEFVCKEGPVFPWSRVRHLLTVREV